MKRITLVLIATLALAPPAVADSKTKSDGNDTKGFLDIEEVSHKHDGDYLVHKIVTYENWDSSDLTSGTYIEFTFDLPDDPSGRMIEINYKNGDLKAKMYQIDPPRYLRNVDVSRPSNHAVKVKFKKGQLKSGIDSYEWSARTSYDGSDCNKVVCVDTRPNSTGSWISHTGL